jgi:endogenous inhibitor of DNA gyrase (YacG/DUF329 family)
MNPQLTSPTRILTQCPTCGREFWYKRSWPRKYCSHACKGVAMQKPPRPSTLCEVCGASFITHPAKRNRFCSLACWGRWSSANLVGESHHNTGREFGRPTNAGPVVTATCQICGADFVTKTSHQNRRHTCSKQCQNVWQSRTQSGENSPAWRGGHLPYYGPSWHSAKRATRRRDGVCQDCGTAPEVQGKALDVHHLVPFRAYGVERHEEANRLENLVALCVRCHLNREWASNRREPVHAL